MTILQERSMRSSVDVWKQRTSGLKMKIIDRTNASGLICTDWDVDNCKQKQRRKEDKL